MNSDKDNVVNIKAAQTEKAGKNQLSQTFKKVHRLFLLGLKPGISDFFNNLDDVLFSMAEKAQSNDQQNLYFDAMRVIRKKKESLLKEFSDNVTQVFGLFAKRKYNYFTDEKDGKASSFNNMSLVDDDELDIKLAASQLVSRADSYHQQQLFALKTRFSVLAAGHKLETEQVPVSPSVIVHSFANAISKLEATSTVKIIVIKLLERSLVSVLSPIYKDINQYLAEQGICPEIKFSATHLNRNPRPPAPAAPGQPESPLENNQVATLDQQQAVEGEYSSGSGLPQNQDYDAIMSLLNQRHGVPAGQSSGNFTPVNHNEISQGIHQIQGQMLQNSAATQDISPMQLKDLLLKKLQELDVVNDNKNVKRTDEDTIDLVGMLFQFLVDDRNLPDKIQALLARLQLPYLQLALDDRKVFTQKEHPARKLLDVIAQSSIGWTEENDKKNLFITKIQSIVDQILESQSEGTDIDYEELNDDFIEFEEKYRKRAEIIEKRTSEKVSGQERVEMAKKQTAEIIRKKMQGRSLPDLVRDILLTPWANVLILAHLREADDPKLLVRFTRFVDYLIATCIKSPKITIDVDFINKLVKILEQGLMLVAYDEIGIRSKSEELKKCLLSINGLTQNEEDHVEVEIIEPEKILEISQDSTEESTILDYLNHTNEEEDNIPQIEDEHLEAVKQMIKGDWVEFLYDEKGLKAKLSWISPISSRLLFVNSRGLKVTDKEPYELAHEMRKERARILQQIPLFDRALSAIAKQMENDQDVQSDESSE
ncbi:DUF1631 domain-containing protein [Marinicella sp. W31]|uniref:DUF1631 domain-containing protein n=1 Tax=Marinicella sp. W31 TaxID=3023713 RepID=UPI003756B97D